MGEAEKIKSRLDLHRIGVEHIEFTRDIHRHFEGEMMMKFSVQYLEKEPGPSDTERGVRLRLELTGEINGEQVIYVDLVMVAAFIIHETDPEIFDTLFKKNTIAIMLPYMQSEVTLITAQPDAAPVLLPAIDVNELVDGWIEEDITKN